LMGHVQKVVWAENLGQAVRTIIDLNIRALAAAAVP